MTGLTATLTAAASAPLFVFWECEQARRLHSGRRRAGAGEPLSGMIDPVPESVWDYPRPPRVEPSSKRVRVVLGGAAIADTTRAHRVLETSHPPVYYVPLEDVARGSLEPARGRGSFCEWKGRASYLDAIGGDGRRVERAAWTYPDPTPAFEAIRDAVAFYPALMDECTLDGELVEAQDGGFYGGWVTSDILGPFKGGPGTLGW